MIEMDRANVFSSFFFPFIFQSLEFKSCGQPNMLMSFYNGDA